MSIVRAAANPYGPATLDIQIEQGGDFILPFILKKDNATWDLRNAVITAKMSPTWAPGQSEIDFTIVSNATDLALGKFVVKFPAASSTNLGLPSPPRKSLDPNPFQLGGWILTIEDGGVIVRYIDGTVYLDRDPCL